MSDSRTTRIGIVLTIFGLCTIPISLSQLIVGSLYNNECPANQMMPTFNIVSGVIGLFAALLFLIAGISHLKKKDGRTWTIVALIGGFIMYGVFIPWYMYGGTLTSVDKSAKSRQSTNSSDSTTYCISYIQQSIDGIVLLYWISMAILILSALIFFLKKR
ncbi:unnamed protein product [Rotaria socialis]|uniref:Uncharacterized protein n=2 Tax=Rotaria socialis TaxID=392032 RepID=A0A821P7N1_9BILA|nr:unnamed protein product [Rotaria socialis]CAF3351663.1 unnamed protein product [Rotaria socialis]CAF3687381.1 unnamed protein product [Rotaria socialis]CAF4345766.1 unnamed protein product [Rotaria socialis]CAF4388217.1 unnamed protein product [Rotaria socialis]